MPFESQVESVMVEVTEGKASFGLQEPRVPSVRH